MTHSATLPTAARHTAPVARPVAWRELALLIPLMLAAYSVLCLVGLGLIVLGIGYLADESMVSAGPTM